MKVALWTTAAFAAMAMSASAASAATVMSPVGQFGPLPVTDAATSYATRTPGVFNGITDTNTGTKTATTFVDDFAFAVGPSLGETAAKSYDTSLSGNFFNMESKSNITSFDVTLFEGTPLVGTPTQLATTGLDTLGTKGSFDYNLEADLTPGTSYFLQADVTVPAKDVGHYGLTAITAPISAVPEPGTWALLFAGVAMMGGMLRLGRRNGWAMNVA